jgi:hypothetical protein
MDKLITINVGGVLYTTTAATLRNAPGHSMLAATGAMLAADPPQMQPGGLDANGHLFIDRDGPLFAYILRFLRNGGRVALPADASTTYAIQLEAEFFGLANLVTLTQDHISDLEEAEAEKDKMLKRALRSIASSQDAIATTLKDLSEYMQNSFQEALGVTLQPILDLANGLENTSNADLDNGMGPTLLQLLHDRE